jgi:hypothetical protein
VNYGSNLAGTGGGEPAEAAAWVAYANGSPADQKVIGKDSTGYDWKTVGYWASLRASKPLEADDGQNFLRIAHLMQDGAANIDWLELHKPSFLDDSNKPGPVFFALQMIHRLAQINDSIVAAHSSHSLLAVHAIQRKDGSLGLLLINKDPKEPATVKIKSAAFNWRRAGCAWTMALLIHRNGYLTTGGPVSDLGNIFTLSVPAYSITDIVMAKAK